MNEIREAHDSNSGDSPHVGTDPVSVRYIKIYRVYYLVYKMKWNFGGQTRGLSLHAVVLPEWEFYIKEIWTGLYSCLLHE